MQIALYHAADGLQGRLEAAEAAQARLAARGALAGPHAAPITAALRHEVIYQSARLQGNLLSAAQVARVLAGPDGGTSADPAEREVRNLGLGLDYVEMLAAGTVPLTERLIRILHAIVMRGLPLAGHEAGTYRAEDLPDFGHPVPPALDVIPAMGAFARWLPAGSDAPAALAGPILRATYAHTRLLHIHPFANGNGRVARLLLNLILLRAGFPLVALAGDGRPAYLQGLDAAGRHHDLTPILTLVLDAVDRSLAAYAVPGA